MDGILAQWRRERPDVDASPMAVCGEVWRAGERLRQGVIANIASADLDMAGFDVLLTLRRNGREQALSPSALAKDMMLSTSAMTNRLDRLEKRGGEWKIANRYCIVEWSGTIIPGPIPYADIPDVHASGVPSRDRSDPSYTRPLVNKRAKRKP